jgi:hypothetical protein
MKYQTIRLSDYQTIRLKPQIIAQKQPKIAHLTPDSGGSIHSKWLEKALRTSLQELL